MAADILAATSSINISAMNISAGASTTAGQAFCISELDNNGMYCWQLIPSGAIVSATANLMGSIDGVNFFLMDTINTSDTAGTGPWKAWTGWNATATANTAAGEMRWVMQTQVNYLRIDVTQVNGGGTVTGTFSVFEGNR